MTAPPILESSGRGAAGGTALRGMAEPRRRSTPTCWTCPPDGNSPDGVFINSMSDLFHESVPVSFIEKVFAAIAENPRHMFQALTRQSEWLRRLSNRLPWPRNLWMGVTVESIRRYSRIDDLRESGPRAQPMAEGWHAKARGRIRDGRLWNEYPGARPAEEA